MTTQNKEIVLGDVVKWELPHEYCRAKKNVSRDLTATVGLNVGEIMEADAAVAQIHTADTKGNTADGGTFKLGYKGQWTAALAWNLIFADVNTAFNALSTVVAEGDTVVFAQAVAETWIIHGSTGTWQAAGQRAEIEVDGRLLLDGAVVMDDEIIPVSTIGSTVAEVVIAVGTGDATCILLEKVTLADLKAENNISRAFLVRGSAIVDSDQVTVLAAEKADALVALTALGIQFRTEPTIYQSGPPTS